MKLVISPTFFVISPKEELLLNRNIAACPYKSINS